MTRVKQAFEEPYNHDSDESHGNNSSLRELGTAAPARHRTQLFAERPV